MFDAWSIPLRERIAVIIPTLQTTLEPNGVIKARILPKGMPEGIQLEVEHAKIRMEMTRALFD